MGCIRKRDIEIMAPCLWIDPNDFGGYVLDKTYNYPTIRKKILKSKFNPIRIKNKKEY